MNDDTDLTPIPAQTAGPYFHLGLCGRAAVGCMVTALTQGERMQLTCRVFDGDGHPVNDALIELWQANAQGKYPDEKSASAFPGFGRLATGEDGECTFETIRPGRVPGNGNIPQAPHINVSLFARGVLARLATRIYFGGDPANDEDPVLTLVPPDRRATLLARPEAGGWRFDIHLCGERETVFFDV